jgi:hypothetical protein
VWFSTRGDLSSAQALASGNHIPFRWGNASYVLESSRPMLARSGNLDVPMRLEPGWKPAAKDSFNVPVDPNMIRIGATGD